MFIHPSLKKKTSASLNITEIFFKNLILYKNFNRWYYYLF